MIEFAEQKNKKDFEQLLCALLLLPATNASCEHSLRDLKRLKTAVRKSMVQARRNSQLIIHVCRELTDRLDGQMNFSQFVMSIDNGDGHGNKSLITRNDLIPKLSWWLSRPYVMFLNDRREKYN